MKAISGIYAITNTVNGKRYVGSAARYQRRINEHFRCLRNRSHHNSHLQAAFYKYGEAVFVPSLLERVSPECLLDAEQKYLDANRDGYNIAKRAESPMKGMKHSLETLVKIGKANKGHLTSAETRAKLSEARRGRTQSQETRAKLCAAWKGRIIPPETRAKMAASLKGHRHSAETKAKISDANKGRRRSPEVVAKMKARMKGRRPSVETVAKIVEARKWYRHSPETKAKMAATQRKRWERIRLEREQGMYQL